VSGVQCGTYLERLEQLRQQVDQAIAAERRRVALEGPIRLVARPHQQVPRGNRVDMRLASLGVTALQVKEWAVEAGLLDQVRRGRVALSLVEAYADADGDPVQVGRQRLADCVEEAYA
jgi:hypothetical protein